MARGFPQTALLALLAMTIALTGGILAGAAAALRPETWIDRVVMGWS